MTDEERAVKIADAIMSDIGDRSGLGDELAAIDEDIVADMRHEWVLMIEQILEE